mgnify:CR=1 FL=1
MSPLDIIIIACLIFSAAVGLFFGLIKTVGSVFSTIISIIAAGLFYKILAIKFLPFLFGNENFAKTAAFIVIYVVCVFVLNLIIKLVDKIFQLPILRGFNRLGGLLVGLAEGLILISLTLYIIDKFSWLEQISQFIHASQFSAVLIIIGKYLALAIPGI